MTGKMKLYIGLLVLGLAMVGTGLWFLFNPMPVIKIPEGEPIIIAMELDFVMGGKFSELHIYGDGTVIYREDKGLRMWTLEHPPTRTWKTGLLQEEELNNLIDFFKNSKFDELDAYYQYPDPSSGGGVTSDMYCTISISSGNFSNTVKTFGYLTPDEGMTYPDMPYPLNEIYKRLRVIIDDKTEEVYRGLIKD
jgi:hypothetical protein